ncbi:DUF6958 family protein [Hirschia maritima]|uniref:DUF6958 family protein n=1 Tax=Hirschia maritima TaxID=1121961 RepID=UPI0003731C95|nr:hypothetical protein [Hirschia maritima]
MEEKKTDCRTPNQGRIGVTRISSWKYDLVRTAILRAVGEEGILFKDLKQTVRQNMTMHDLEKLGSLSWHMTTVKLNMEAEGELSRSKQQGLQFIKRAQ